MRKIVKISNYLFVGSSDSISMSSSQNKLSESPSSSISSPPHHRTHKEEKEKKRSRSQRKPNRSNDSSCQSLFIDPKANSGEEGSVGCYGYCFHLLIMSWGSAPEPYVFFVFLSLLLLQTLSGYMTDD